LRLNQGGPSWAFVVDIIDLNLGRNFHLPEQLLKL
jgi:hypothetical protein